jgi:hypothetical protein
MVTDIDIGKFIHMGGGFNCPLTSARSSVSCIAPCEDSVMGFQQAYCNE